MHVLRIFGYYLGVKVTSINMCRYTSYVQKISVLAKFAVTLLTDTGTCGTLRQKLLG